MLETTPFKIRDNIKILAYGSKIGILEPLKRMVSGKAFEEPEDAYQTNEVKIINEEEQKIKDLKRIENFKSLITLYGFDINRTSFLLDSRKTSQLFLDYCEENHISIIDCRYWFESDGS